MEFVETILFDLDGTLIDSKKDLALSVHHIQEKYGRPLSPDDEIARFIGDGAMKLVERAVGPLPPDELERALTLFKGHYREHALDFTRAYPGVTETLEHFKAKKLAVVTNKPERISKFILEKLDLLKYFPVVLGGDSVAKKKPDPEGIHKALELLGTAQTRPGIIVGDGYQDVLAGRAVGFHTCGIISNIGDPALLSESQPDYTIHSMPELMRIIS